MSDQGSRPCKIAVVGAGGMASEHIKAFQDIPDVTVAGIANRTVEKAQQLAEKFSIPLVFGNVADLYEGTGADIVLMAVYEPAINTVAKACFAYPWAVFMEKPVGLNLADAEDIEAAANKDGRKVWVGLNRRSLSSTVSALDDLADDQDWRFIHVQDQQSLEAARSIGHSKNVVDNWMYANSIHLVDYLLTFGRGEVAEVVPVVPWTPENPETVLAKVSFSSGDLGLYECIWEAPGPWACTVTTTRRRWEMRPLEKAVFLNAGERSPNEVDPHHWDEDFKPGFRLQAERVIAAWRGEPSPQPTLTEATRTMRLVSDIYGV